MANVDQNKSLQSHRTKGLARRKNEELKSMMQFSTQRCILGGGLDGRGRVPIMIGATKNTNNQIENAILWSPFLKISMSQPTCYFLCIISLTPQNNTVK